ncbi:uncharacterized [Tachysurus ichikawai]
MDFLQLDLLLGLKLKGSFRAQIVVRIREDFLPAAFQINEPNAGRLAVTAEAEMKGCECRTPVEPLLLYTRGQAHPARETCTVRLCTAALCVSYSPPLTLLLC